MLKIKTRIEGFAELRKTLQALPIEVERKVLQSASRAVAREVVKDFKQAAPRSSEDDRSPKSKQYGHMIENLRVKTPRGGRNIIAYSKDAFWAQWYEFGNSRQRPRPTFRPVWDGNIGKYQTLLLRQIGRQLAATAKRLAGGYKAASRTLGVKRRR